MNYFFSRKAVLRHLEASTTSSVLFEDVWDDLRRACLRGQFNQQEWRRLWRDYHPNGKRRNA